MPSPPPAPRRTRTAHAPPTRQTGRHGQSSGFDSSDDFAFTNGANGGARQPSGMRGHPGNDTSSFTFSDTRTGTGIFSRPQGPPGMLGGGGGGGSGETGLMGSDALISNLTRRGGGGGSSKGLPPSSFLGDSSFEAMGNTGSPEHHRLQGGSNHGSHLASPAPAQGVPGPSRVRPGPSSYQPRLSNPSLFAASPRLLQRRRGADLLPGTPTGGGQAAGLNADGSFSVIRDEGEANNSGLLDLGPQGSLGRNGDLFGVGKGMRGGGTPLRPRRGAGAGGSDPLAGPSASTGWTPARNVADAANASMIEHSLSGVPESDEVDLEGGVDDQQAIPRDAHLLQRLRLWRQDAMEHHLYDTAIFWGEKVLCMEDDEAQRPNDAYFLAKAYFLTHQYSRAEHLLTVPLPAIAPPQPDASTAPPPSATETETVTDEDALQAALQGTKKHSVLSAAMFDRPAATSSLQGGVLRQTDMRAPSECSRDDDDDDDRDDGAYNEPYGSASPQADRKRKDRDFTVSGTGTGSEGSQDDEHGDSDRRAQTRTGSGAEEGPDGLDNAPTNTQPDRWDFRHGPSGGSANDVDYSLMKIPKKVYDAWAQERGDAVKEVQAQARIHRQQVLGKSLVDSSAACRFLAAKCMARLGKFGEALDLIGEESGRWIKGGASGKYGYAAPSSDGLLKVASSVAHLRGLIYLRLDNLTKAREGFLEALRLDVKNYDAFSAIVDGKLLSDGEAWSLIEGLEWEAQSNGDQQSFDFIRLCYTARLGKEDQANAVRAASARRALWDTYGRPEHKGGLYHSADLLYALAEDLYARRRYADALTVTQRILSLDSEHEQTLDLHIGCMASLSSPNSQGHGTSHRPQLFLLANRLVEEHPDRASSWYAVGAWYSTSSRWQDARKYYSKATLLNPRHLAAWSAFAHSFSLEGESEQALLAYSSVVRNFPNVAYAKVCLGSEHIRAGNLKLARLYLEGAMQQADAAQGGWGGNGSVEADEEMGVLCFSEGRLEDAVTHLSRAVAASKAAREPGSSHVATRLNLAWALFRLQRSRDQDGEDEGDGKARQAFEDVLALDADNVGAHIGLGMLEHRRGNLADAIGIYHEALAIDPRHPQATELLQVAVDEYADTPLASSGGGREKGKGRAADDGLASSLGFPPEATPALHLPRGPGAGISLNLGELSLGGMGATGGVSRRDRDVTSGMGDSMHGTKSFGAGGLAPPSSRSRGGRDESSTYDSLSGSGSMMHLTTTRVDMDLSGGRSFESREEHSGQAGMMGESSHLSSGHGLTDASGSAAGQSTGAEQSQSQSVDMDESG